MSTAAGRRVALVTGASGAIGEAIATGIASAPHHEVVLLCRDERRARDCVRRVRERSANEVIRYELADLSSATGVAALAGRWRGPLNVIVNNAAAAPRRRVETAEGLELQFATNVMGYVWMMRYFADILLASAPARVVNVASYWAGDLDIDDLQFVRRRYDNGVAYRQSKQADRMLSVAFAQRWRDRHVTVNACHPGDVASTLSADLGFSGHQTPAQAAETPVWLATGTTGGERSGGYFSQRREERCRFGVDAGAVERLFEACARF